MAYVEAGKKNYNDILELSALGKHAAKPATDHANSLAPGSIKPITGSVIFFLPLSPFLFLECLTVALNCAVHGGFCFHEPLLKTTTTTRSVSACMYMCVCVCVSISLFLCAVSAHLALLYPSKNEVKRIKMKKAARMQSRKKKGLAPRCTSIAHCLKKERKRRFSFTSLSHERHKTYTPICKTDNNRRSLVLFSLVNLSFYPTGWASTHLYQQRSNKSRERKKKALCGYDVERTIKPLSSLDFSAVGVSPPPSLSMRALTAAASTPITGQ